MNIVYHTAGMTGSGHMVIGISIANALRRKGLTCDFTIVHGSPFSQLAERLGVQYVKIQTEDEKELSRENFSSSILYKTINSLKPDILIVDQFWFMLHHFIDELSCTKIFLCRQVKDSTFSIDLPAERILFNAQSYDLVLATEPFKSCVEMEHINPVIIRNRDEVLSKKDALEKLEIKHRGKICLFAFNGRPGEFRRIKKDYSYLEDVGYQMVYSTNFKGGLFPVVDYFNAVNLIICGAGYNAFWEVMYFKKEAIFVPVRRRFESQSQRIHECGDYYFEENGADQLVDIIPKL